MAIRADVTGDTQRRPTYGVELFWLPLTGSWTIARAFRFGEHLTDLESPTCMSGRSRSVRDLASGGEEHMASPEGSSDRPPVRARPRERARCCTRSTGRATV